MPRWMLLAAPPALLICADLAILLIPETCSSANNFGYYIIKYGIDLIPNVKDNIAFLSKFYSGCDLVTIAMAICLNSCAIFLFGFMSIIFSPLFYKFWTNNFYPSTSDATKRKVTISSIFIIVLFALYFYFRNISTQTGLRESLLPYSRWVVLWDAILAGFIISGLSIVSAVWKSHKRVTL